MAVKHSHDPEIHQAHADTDVKFFEVCSDTGGIFLEAHNVPDGKFFKSREDTGGEFINSFLPLINSH